MREGESELILGMGVGEPIEENHRNNFYRTNRLGHLVETRVQSVVAD